jgi:hypothetical protein
MFIPLKMVLIGIDPYPFGFETNMVWLFLLKSRVLKKMETSSHNSEADHQNDIIDHFVWITLVNSGGNRIILLNDPHFSGAIWRVCGMKEWPWDWPRDWHSRAKIFFPRQSIVFFVENCCTIFWGFAVDCW